MRLIIEPYISLMFIMADDNKKGPTTFLKIKFCFSVISRFNSLKLIGPTLFEMMHDNLRERNENVPSLFICGLFW